MFHFSPTLRMIIDCRLIQQSIKQRLYKIKPCGACKRFDVREGDPHCGALILTAYLVYDITRNIFVNPNCYHVFTKR